MSRILLIEDHDRLAHLMCNGLVAAGIAVDMVDRIDSAWVAIQQMPYQALVLDRGLPDGDGLLLLKKLRNAGLSVPCLVLTARDALHDRLEGLESGADDYLPKPFAMDEMVARVKALLRRPVEFHPIDTSHGDLRLHTESGVLFSGNESITLASAELHIMQLLLYKHDEVVRRSALEAAAWGLSEAVTPNALDVALHRLRRKLLAIGSRQRIANVRGMGYALRQADDAK
ncbi:MULTISPECIES: response regulator transcription factor [unclassified Halomonas]|uniref:response regulator transcription factor n=1 Tax=unclassified Halomonas TaxID=2609666 RepID=UPI0006DA417B|nr:MULTISPECIES: response regulator transcription factor [unclassified Halomonas]KPQ26438.1 MAG: Response regulators consisting of a CheY-like receiver domain and a winged-helix DNA-binding domain [Halomonas sp. HL-93]SBR50808.1 DNA-binding response regulator, OmpR family, contains REC and winged-helix (wHTH) domain [Halomonas sp. HL-93]SNY97047.1 DNA-binding response regulator, OmpR family, contains REC and winged-helix (wHTH) domain [Halomonas sp. hl-4]